MNSNDKTELKQLIKKCIRKIPFAPAAIRQLTYFRTLAYLKKQKFSSREELFADYFQKKFWGTEETASGHGSTVEYTKKLREGLEKIIKERKFNSLLDAPCGDYNWFRFVNRNEDVKYIGGDIVKELIAENIKKYGNDNTVFMEMDIVDGEIPDADLWICRDALFHFSYKDIASTLMNFLNRDTPYILTTSHTNHDSNSDIVTGNYRLVNLEKPPFNFCKPEVMIDDWIDGYPVRHMCLWHKDSIREQIINLNSMKI